MKSQFSLTGLSLAIMLFAVTAAMHEASRAEPLLPHGSALTPSGWTDLARGRW